MANIAADINQTRAMRISQRRIEGFAQEFGEAHRNLVCHAAFPLVLTPDLLYQIWANFVPQAPWTAVAHVLLSRLCRQVGYETYEMDIADRNLLLRELKEEFGQERFDELEEFLLDYAAQRLTDDDADTQNLREAQEWTALAYTKPNEAASKLTEALATRMKEGNIDEVLRITSLVETLAEPLVESGFIPLLVYSQGMKSFALEDFKVADVHFSELLKVTKNLSISETNFIIPKQTPAPINQIENPVKLNTQGYVLHSLNSARILIVDNTPDNIILLETILEVEGYQIEKVTSSMLALHVMENSPPDLIILAALMPDIDGYELTRRIRRSSKISYIPIILITAFNEASLVEGFDSGADDFVRKPFDQDELLARVRSLLRLKMSLDTNRHNLGLTKSTKAELLHRFNQGIPSDIQRDYEELIMNIKNDNFTDDEHKKLLKLIDKIKNIQVQIIKDVADLAALHGISLATVMKNLDINTVNNI